MQKFEYDQIRSMTDDGYRSLLNAKGEQGWEAFGVTVDRDNYTIVYLKRPIADTTDRG